MLKFEYKAMPCEGDLINWLNKQGQSGWAYHSPMPDNPGWYIFHRILI